MNSKRQRLTGTIQLCRLFDERGDRSWIHRANFESQRNLIVRGVRVRVVCALHVVPGSGRDIPFQSSVTIWQGSRKKLADWKAGGWNAKLSAIGWYEACERALERYGYRGKWQASPWGRFGDFWKMLKGAEAPTLEVETLDEILRQPWQDWRTPRSERGDGPRKGTGVIWHVGLPRRRLRPGPRRGGTKQRRA